MMKNEKSAGVSGENFGVRRPLVLTLLLLVAILAVVFWRLFDPAYVLFSNDGPLGGLAAEQNRMPTVLRSIWVNLSWLGAESLAQPPTISSIMRALVSPVGYAKLLCPASLFIAGIGACFCFRRFKLAPLACVLGGLAAALNSDFFSTACWGVSTQVIGFGAMYLAVGLLANPTHRRRWINVVLAGLAVGIGVMEAYDIGALFSLVVAAFAVYQAFFLNEQQTSGLQKIGRGIGTTLLVAFFAAFIAAHALSGLVGTQIKGVSTANQDERMRQAQWDSDTYWSVPKLETLQVMVPGVFGFRDDWYMYETDSPHEDQYWGSIGTSPGLQRQTGTGFYAGVPVVVIALWAVFQSFRKKKSVFTEIQCRTLWFWTGVLVISLLLAFGRNAPFYRFFYALPYASAIRNPTKFMHVFSWVLVIIFAYGVHGLRMIYMQSPVAKVGGILPQFRKWYGSAASFERVWMVGCVIVFGFGLLAWAVYSRDNARLMNYLETVGFTPDNAPGIARFSLQAVGCFMLFFGILIGLLALIFSGQFTGSRAKWGGVLLGALLIFDLSRADIPWISYWNTDYKYAIDPVIKFLADQPYEHRVALLDPNPNDAQTGLLQNMYAIDWKQHLFPYENIQCSEVVQEPRVAIDKERFSAALPLYTSRGMNVFNLLRFWQLSNTRYILGPAKIDPTGTKFKPLLTFNFVAKRPNPSSWPEDYRAEPDTNGELAISEYLDALPRAKLYSNWKVDTNDDDTLQQIASPAFNPEEQVLVAENIPAPTATNSGVAAGTVEINPNYKSKRVEMSADVKTPAILMLDERYNDKWQVEVDGKPAPLLRCDFITRGVLLQPGKHDVVFRFVSPSKTFYLNIAAIVLGLGLWGFLIVDRAGEEAPAPEFPSNPEAA